MRMSPEEWLSSKCVEHVEIWGRVPTEAEMKQAVVAEAIYADSPFCSMSEAERLAQIRAVLENFGIIQVEREEISVKARDGEANLNNRRYNDANF